MPLDFTALKSSHAVELFMTKFGENCFVLLDRADVFFRKQYGDILMNEQSVLWFSCVAG